MKPEIKKEMEQLRNEILNDSISWKEISLPNPEVLMFDFFDHEKHSKGYGTIKLRVINDGNNAFVTASHTSGYFRTYAELKEANRLEVGRIITSRSAGNTSYIKIY